MLKPLRLSYFAFEDKENLMNGNTWKQFAARRGKCWFWGKDCGQPVHMSLANFDWGPIRGGRVLPMMAYTGRLHPKGVSFSGFRYMKG